MSEQPTTPAPDADAALRLLDETWAYFTPGPRPVPPTTAYDDAPVAA
ncbi:hypothetical protein [Roseicyclus persicicus]|uniref:Uncharacterized protein n=1 Tax=Roseicyclus persicicus TaxID=2650661 RepID=A0A7X6JW85_9RHOB|nr:hypothetical protein [Roseibacterium persicicum]NKX44097.1 hypothetical protein [Roseibacterium persicicum]